MKVESLGNSDYSIYINNLYIKHTSISNKNEVGLFLKELIVKLKNNYGIILKGFYEVDVKINKKIGVFIVINKVNKYDFYSDEIDLKININFNSKVYYKTIDYSIIDGFSGIKYKEGYYYIDIDNIIDMDKIVIKLVEYGTFCFDF